MKLITNVKHIKQTDKLKNAKDGRENGKNEQILET
jgi:hypothetical protein